MAVTISKKAEKLLNKIEERREIRGEGPKKQTGPEPEKIEPIANTPEGSLLKALWALKGRPNQILMMVNRKNGWSRQVKDYNPVTREIEVYHETSSADGSRPTFTTHMTQQVEYNYGPLWR